MMLFFVLLTAASANLCEPEPPAIEHGARDERRVALTFDACSTKLDLLDESVYGTLEKLSVRATIFIGGEWAERRPELARRIAANPLLEVASHCYNHPHLTKLNDEELVGELRKSQWAIFNTTGIWPHLLRAPYGEINPHVVETADRLGLRIVQYDLPSGDPDPRLKPDKIVRWVVDTAKDGSVVVMHINGNGVHTAEVLPKVVRELRRKNFELVTVSELLNEPDTFTDGAACSP